MAQGFRSVTFLGTPLQFVAIVSGLVFHDGMGYPVNLPPFLDDLKRRDVFLPNVKTWTSYPPESPPVDPNRPLALDPERQQITLERSWYNEAGYSVSAAWTVTATGKGPDKSDITIPSDGPHWAMIEEGWNWLISELTARGRIEGGAPLHAGPEDEIAQRRQRVMNLWKARRGDTVRKFKEHTAEELSVSVSTVRDDLAYLRLEGLIE